MEQPHKDSTIVDVILIATFTPIMLGLTLTKRVLELISDKETIDHFLGKY